MYLFLLDWVFRWLRCAIKQRKSSIRTPHSVELPRSIDQSEGVSPNSLPSLTTLLIIGVLAV